MSIELIEVKSDHCGWEDRRPILVVENTIYIGGDECTHEALLRQARKNGTNTYYDDAALGWVGHNPEGEPEHAVYNRGTQHEVGWYGKPPYAAHKFLMDNATTLAQNSEVIT